jgi:hypothetical protein
MSNGVCRKRHCVKKNLSFGLPLRQPWKFDHRANFDRANSRSRNLPGDADGFVQVFGVN